MSQGQPRRETGTNLPDVKPVADPVKYGDVFNVSGELANQPVAPRDAALMQSAESQVLGWTQKGGVAATMQSAATLNQEAGYVHPTEYSAAVGGQGMKVTESDIPGRRVVTESVGGQVVGQFSTPVPEPSPAVTGSFTIGDALEAASVTCGDKPVTQSDASAIQAAEMRATGSNAVRPGGVAASAMSAADANERTGDELQKTTLGEVLADAKRRLVADKVATTEDAEKVRSAELRNNPNLTTVVGGVSENVTAAANLNEAAP
ncbi:late embryogenesis abundant protein D-34-like [Nymphaea colorata]|nr:late embryogenesis abundant protein D-34-like [Nymphaea colorata]